MTWSPGPEEREMFERLRRYIDSLSESEPSFMGTLRNEAASLFESRGLPGKRDEDWKFNSLNGISFPSMRLPARQGEESALAAACATGLLPRGEGRVILIWNGQLLPFDASGLPEGVTLGPVASHGALAEPLLRDEERWSSDSLSAFSRALAQDPLVLHLAEGAQMDTPVHLVHITTAVPEGFLVPMVHPLVVVHAERESRGMLIESHLSLGDGLSFSSPTSEVLLEAGAHFEHIKMLRENQQAWHVGRSRVDLHQGSHFGSWEMMFGGRMSRRELTINHRGENAYATLNSLQLGREDQCLDARTLVRHAAAGCQTRELYKSVLADRSRGIFDGLIHVEQAAQQTDARQTNRNLVLSDDALACSIPRLEIYADDVRCAHGATTGALDEQQIFYLRTRGFDLPTARATLVYAFASEVLESIPYEPLRRRIMDEVFMSLPDTDRMQEAA